MSTTPHATSTLPPGASTELYPGEATELAARARREDAIRAANRDPLPGPLLEAFAGLPQSIAGLTVRPLVHYDFVLLRRLNSPLLKQATDGGQTEFTDEQGYEMIYQFTRPAREVAQVLEKGPEAFRAAAMEAIGMSLGPVEVGLLIRAVEREFVRAFSTAIKYEPAATGESPGSQVFTPPPPV